MKFIYSTYLPLPGYITSLINNDQLPVGLLLLLGSISESAALVSLKVWVGMAKCRKTSIFWSFFFATAQVAP